MRTIKELLQLILKEGNLGFSTLYDVNFGLCSFIYHLKEIGEITMDEFIAVKKYIRENRPKSGSKHYRKSQAHSEFYWKILTWAPRRNWLIDQIKSLKQWKKTEA